MFPQLIAGPIVRYRDIQPRLSKRSHTVEGFASGVEIFIIGLAKKVIFANNLGIIADRILREGVSNTTTLQVWIGAVFLCYKFIMIFAAIRKWQWDLAECLVSNSKRILIIRIFSVLLLNFGEDGIFLFPPGSEITFIFHWEEIQ